MENAVPKVSAEELAKIYIKIRDAKEATVERHKQELGDFNDQLEAISNEMLEMCKSLDVSSMRTNEGTIIRKVTPTSTRMTGVQCTSLLKSMTHLDYCNNDCTKQT